MNLKILAFSSHHAIAYKSDSMIHIGHFETNFLDCRVQLDRNEKTNRNHCSCRIHDCESCIVGSCLGREISKARIRINSKRDNIDWGRVRISNQLKRLNIFFSASTVRNILQRPKPKNASPVPITCPKNHMTQNQNGCRIPTWYPNHLWSADLTEIYYWGLWKIYVLVTIDHFSRKGVAVSPLEGPNAGMVSNALEAVLVFYLVFQGRSPFSLIFSSVFLY